MDIKQINEGGIDHELLTQEYHVDLTDRRTYVLKMHGRPNHPLVDEIFDWLEEYAMRPEVYSWGTPMGVERMYLVFDQDMHAMMFRLTWTN